MSKMHWASTPEGRERMSKIQKRLARERKAKKMENRLSNNENHNQVRAAKRATFNELARIGAQHELSRLRKEVEKLEIFLAGTQK